MTVQERVFILYGLSHLVYSLGEAGNLSGCRILMEYALRAGLVDRSSSGSKRALCCSLVTGLDCCVYLLNSSLCTRLDRLVSFSLGSVYQNPLLCRFDVSQDTHLHFQVNFSIL